MITFEKVNNTKYLVKVDNESYEEIMSIVKTICNGDYSRYETYSNDMFINSVIAKKVASEFIDKEFNKAGKDIVILETTIGKRKLDISVGKLELAKDEFKYISGVLYE